MHRNRLLFIGFFIFATSVGAQSYFSKNIKGRVYSKDGDVAATHVLNTTSNRATITDIDGFFEINVSLNDTLVFSAVQFQKKSLIITAILLEQKSINVALDDALTVLDEVVVTPYNLSGDIAKDLQVIPTLPVVTAHTLDLPNAYARKPSQAERMLYEATSGAGILPLNPILNGISGRTKMLKERVARNKLYYRTERVRAFYADSIFRIDLKIPENRIDDLMYFCEVDPSFQRVVDTHDHLKIWEFIRQKSLVYLKNNAIEASSDSGKKQE